MTEEEEVSVRREVSTKEMMERQQQIMKTRENEKKRGKEGGMG